MKWILGALLGLGLFTGVTPLVRAYEVSVPDALLPYEVMVQEGSPEREHLILGTLNGDPVMYEITSDVQFTLTVEIKALPGGKAQPQFSGIIVRQNEDLGVAEVARQRATETNWPPVRDKVTGLTYQAGPFWSESVPAGTYRIEVSTPTNQGAYMLQLGTVPERVGYRSTVRSIAMVYDFYEVSKLRMFNSPYIHYPVGIIVVLGLILATWYWQRRQPKAPRHV